NIHFIAVVVRSCVSLFSKCVLFAPVFHFFSKCVIIILSKIILIPKMSSNINHKNVHAFQKSNTDRNARRRELYKLMPPEKKEILLARRRAKSAEMRKHNLSKSFDLMREPMLLLSEINSTMPSKTNYIKLKEVSNCHFCKAIRFEYEPPAFCCSNGSIQLTSHEIPIELKNLYLENTELSKYFRTYIRTYNNIFAFTSLG
ncbi:hypothetical protein H5410_058367, partial [Solanum commersonii]